jgi:hypothetical protein
LIMALMMMSHSQEHPKTWKHPKTTQETGRVKCYEDLLLILRRALRASAAPVTGEQR